MTGYINQQDLKCPNCESDNFDYEDERRISLEADESNVIFSCLKCGCKFVVTRISHYLNDAEILEKPKNAISK